MIGQKKTLKESETSLICIEEGLTIIPEDFRYMLVNTLWGFPKCISILATIIPLKPEVL